MLTDNPDHIFSSRQDKFEHIYKAYRSRIYRYALTIAKSSYAAEEITQEIFIKIWLSEEIFDQISNVDGYIFKLVRNYSLNFLRKVSNDEKLFTQVAASMQPDINDVDERMILSEGNQLLSEALNLLSKQKKLVYQMSREEGLSLEEIAARLDLSKNTVKNHLVSALRTIREHLFRNGITAPVLFFFFS